MFRQIWRALFLMNLVLVMMTMTSSSAFAQCPTREDLHGTYPEWLSFADVQDLVEMVNDVPHWGIFQDANWLSIADFPQITDLGEMVFDDQYFDFTVRHQGNACVTTQLLAVPDQGTLEVLSVIQVDEFTAETQYRVRPEHPGFLIVEMDLQDQESTTILSGVLFLEVKPKFTITVSLGAGISGFPDTAFEVVSGEQVTYSYTSEFCFEMPQVTLNGNPWPASGQFGVNRDIHIEVMAEQKQIPITVETTRGGGTDHDGMTQVPCGENLTITAAPEHRYNFLNWSGDASGSANPMVIEDVRNELTIAPVFDPLPGAVLWTFPPEGLIATLFYSPPVTANGKVYVAAEVWHPRRGRVYCLNAETGSLIWETEISGGYYLRDCPMAVGDEKVVVTMDDQEENTHYYCLDALSGEVLWTKVLPERSRGKLLLIQDGSVYIHKEHEVICLDLVTGIEMWRTTVPHASYDGDLVISGNSIIRTQPVVTQLDLNSGMIQYQGTTRFDGITPILYEGSYYFGSFTNPGRVIVLDENFTAQLNVQVSGAEHFSNPGIRNGDFWILPNIGASANQILRIDPMVGTVLWSKTITESIQYYWPISLSVGYVYATNNDFSLICLDAETGKEVWRSQTWVGDGNPVISYGKVFVGHSFNFHAIKAQTNGEGDWPLPRRDVRNSGVAD